MNYELHYIGFPHSPTCLNGLGWMDRQNGLSYRDLEDGVSPDSQPKGQYLGHALGKLETRQRMAHKWSNPAKIK